MKDYKYLLVDDNNYKKSTEKYMGDLLAFVTGAGFSIFVMAHLWMATI